MNQQEFESMIGEEVGHEFFNHTVSFVYNFHPAISETKGKTEIADIWKIGKHGILNAMLKEAEEMERLESRLLELREEERAITAKIKAKKELYGKS